MMRRAPRMRTPSLAEPRLGRLALVAAALLGLGSTGVAQEERFEPRGLGQLPDGMLLTSKRSIDAFRTQRVRFNPQGTRWAAAMYGQRIQMAAVLDGEIVAEGLTAYPPRWSSNGEHVVSRMWVGETPDNGWWELVLNGKVQDGPRTGLSEPQVTPDGLPVYWRTVSTKANKLGQDSTKEQAEFCLGGVTAGDRAPWFSVEKASPPKLRAAGDVAFTMITGLGGCQLLRMDARGRTVWIPESANGWFEDWTISPNGRRVAYGNAVSSPEDSAEMRFPSLHIDGRSAGKGFASSSVPVFSRDNKFAAFKVLNQDRMGVATTRGERPKLDWHYVSAPVIDPKGQRVAFAGYTESNIRNELRMYERPQDHWELKGKCSLVVQTLRGGAEVSDRVFDRMEQITFTPDGKGVAYVGERDRELYVVWGAHRYGPYQSAHGLCFDEQGERLAFGVVKEREVRWVVQTAGK